MQAPRPGIYRHYKGNLYQVLEVATHSETCEQLVVYRPLYGERALWVRPLEMFMEEVVVDGVQVPRFAWQYEAAQELGTPLSVKPVVPAATSASRVAVSVIEKQLSPDAPASLDERVRLAMSSRDDKPDFSSVPLFDDSATAIKVGGVIVAIILLLVWIL